MKVCTYIRPYIHTFCYIPCITLTYGVVKDAPEESSALAAELMLCGLGLKQREKFRV